MSAEDRFRDSSGKRECFISMVVSLLDVTTATQQFTVSGYVNAIWQVIPDFEQQEATNKIYPTKKMQEEGMLSVKQQLEDNGKKDDDKKFCEYILESVAPGGTRYYVTDFELTCAPTPRLLAAGCWPLAADANACPRAGGSRSCCRSTRRRCSRTGGSWSSRRRRPTSTTIRRGTATRARCACQQPQPSASAPAAVDLSRAQDWAGTIKMATKFKATLTQRFKMD